MLLDLAHQTDFRPKTEPHLRPRLYPEHLIIVLIFAGSIASGFVRFLSLFH